MDLRTKNAVIVQIRLILREVNLAMATFHHLFLLSRGRIVLLVLQLSDHLAIQPVGAKAKGEKYNKSSQVTSFWVISPR